MHRLPIITLTKSDDTYTYEVGMRPNTYYKLLVINTFLQLAL
jgi:hypothetical protein